MEYPRRIYPVVVSTTIFFFSLILFLSAMGLIPELTEASKKLTLANDFFTPVHATTTVPLEAKVLPKALQKVLPQRIQIPTLNIDNTIINATSSDLATLEAALLRGPVRHPDSSTLGVKGNIVLLGHSSHLPVVRNKAYQAFNDINTLKKGDEIILLYGLQKYVYKVTAVTLKKNYQETIEIKSSNHKLTLITCNNFGAKEDRYIVEAELITT